MFTRVAKFVLVVGGSMSGSAGMIRCLDFWTGLSSTLYPNDGSYRQSKFSSLTLARLRNSSWMDSSDIFWKVPTPQSTHRRISVLFVKTEHLEQILTPLSSSFVDLYSLLVHGWLLSSVPAQLTSRCFFQSEILVCFHSLNLPVCPSQLQSGHDR